MNCVRWTYMRMTYMRHYGGSFTDIAEEDCDTVAQEALS